MVDESCKHKEKVGKPVQINNDAGVDGNAAGKTDNAPFRAAPDGARQVEHRARLTAARQDELTQRRQFGLKTIDSFFEDCRSAGGKLEFAVRAFLRSGVRQLSADRE